MRLQLFHREECPYSATVRNYIDENGIKDHIEYRDVDADPEAMKELEQLTGDHQAPCLVANGQPMLESEDIIAWLDQNVTHKSAA